MKVHHAERWTLINGDCVEAMRRLPENRFDAVVTDPPYELGFMGKSWDNSGVAVDPKTWAAVLRVLKPGGCLLAFGGSRTFHRIACAIEAAGFEIRDTLSWLYGTGFPKSLDVRKAIEASPEYASAPSAEAQRAAVLAYQFDGWGTALKPAWEPIILARKPLVDTVAANVQRYRTGALNVDGCRILTDENLSGGAYSAGGRADALVGDERDSVGQGMFAPGRGASTGYVQPSGRWPANVVLDEHAAALLDEQTGTLKSGSMKAGVNAGRKSTVYSADAGHPLANDIVGSEGGASRFFYVAKACRAERDAGCESLPARSGGEATDRADDSPGTHSPRAGAGRTGGARNIHPTVKPVALMRWLVRLVTPPGGCVLDPFAGSGSTGVAALHEGFAFVGLEQSPEYVEIARCRLAHAVENPCT